jgi:hypothetical protein
MNKTIATHATHVYVIHGGVVVLYTLLSLLATWPLALHVSTHFPGIVGELSQDVWQHAWNVWWVREALLHRFTNPYTTDMLFYPQGASLYLHSLNLPLGIVGIPFLPLIGMVATYNLLTLMVLIGAAYGTFLLARHLTRHDPSAMVAGVVVLCAPQRLMELRGAQLATLADYGVPFALLTVLLALERRTWKMTTLAAVAMLITGLSKWYHLFHVLIVIAIIAVWRGIEAWRRGEYPSLKADAVTWARMGGITTLIHLPFVIPAAIETITSSYARKSDELVFQADLLSLLPRWEGGVWQHMPLNWWEPTWLFGIIPFVLAIAGVVVARKQAALWATIAAIFLLLSLGPTLIVGGHDTGIPLPYALFRHVPMLDTFRAPVRMNAVTAMMMGVLVAMALAHWLRSTSPRRLWGWGWPLVVAGLIVVEAIRLPFPLIDGRVSPLYDQLAQEAGEWSVLEYPLSRFDRDRLEMYAQTYHHHAILTGLISRSVPAIPQEGMPPLMAIQRGDTRPDIVTLSPAQQTQLLQALRVRYVVIRRHALSPTRATTIHRASEEVFGELTSVYSDTMLTAYRIEEMAAWLDDHEGQDARADLPLFVGLRSRWEALEESEYGTYRWMTDDGATLWAYAPTTQRVLFDTLLYSLPGDRSLELWLNGEYVQTIPIAAGRRPRRYLSSPFTLPQGPNTIELRVPEGGVRPKTLGQGNDTRNLTLNVQDIALREVGP